MIDRAFRAWMDARENDTSLLLMAGDNATADELSRRCRAELVARGWVARDGVRIATGTASRGDEIVTLQNDRKLRAPRGEFVRNGTRWQVVGTSDDGSMRVASVENGGMVTLPPEYVREHVALGYALTVHKCQGKTVDRAVVLVDEKMTAAQLYVAMSRGREANCAFVTLSDDSPEDHARDPRSTRSNCSRESCGARGATGPRTTWSAATSRARRTSRFSPISTTTRGSASSDQLVRTDARRSRRWSHERTWWTPPNTSAPRRTRSIAPRSSGAEPSRGSTRPSASRSGRTFPAGSAKAPGIARTTSGEWLRARSSPLDEPSKSRFALTKWPAIASWMRRPRQARWRCSAGRKTSASRGCESTRTRCNGLATSGSGSRSGKRTWQGSVAMAAVSGAVTEARLALPERDGAIPDQRNHRSKPRRPRMVSIQRPRRSSGGRAGPPRRHGRRARRSERDRHC